MSLAFPLTMAQTYCTATYCSGLSAIALRRWISAQRSSALPGRRGSRRRADPRSSAPMEFVHGQHISGDAYRPSGRGAPIPASTRSRYSGITPARWTGTTTATSRLRCRPHGDLHSACRDTPVVRRGDLCKGWASERPSDETIADPSDVQLIIKLLSAASSPANAVRPIVLTRVRAHVEEARHAHPCRTARAGPDESAASCHGPAGSTLNIRPVASSGSW